MRLAILVPACLTGGSVGNVAWRHALEFSRWHEVRVITSDSPEPPGRRIEISSVHAPSFQWLRRWGHGARELAQAFAFRWHLAALARAGGVDAVWCHGHLLAAIAALPVGRARGIPVVMTTHGDPFDRPEGMYSPDLWWLYKKCAPYAYSGATRVHVLSPGMRECAIRGGADSDHVRVVPNGVDPREIGLAGVRSRESVSFLPQGGVRVGYIGALQAHKGVTTLLDACVLLWRRGVDVRVTFAGSGREEAGLKRAAASAGYSDRIRFTGFLPRNRVGAFLADLDVLCVPSHTEALSLAAIEALTAGVPVVGSRTGGIPFVIEDGRTGWLAEPGNAVDLARCIGEAGLSRERLAEFSVNGCREVAQRFTWDSVALQLNAILEEFGQ